MATAKQLNYFRPSGTYGSLTSHSGGEDLLYTCSSQAMCTIMVIGGGGSIKITDNAYNTLAEYGVSGFPTPNNFHVPHGGDRIISKGITGDVYLSVVEMQFPVSGEF